LTSEAQAAREFFSRAAYFSCCGRTRVVSGRNLPFVMLATCGKSVLRLDFGQRFSSRRHPPELKRSIVENPQLPIKTEVR
jgi:hypothetical protein